MVQTAIHGKTCMLKILSFLYNQPDYNYQPAHCMNSMLCRGRFNQRVMSNRFHAAFKILVLLSVAFGSTICHAQKAEPGL
jgi:hypothetical protein